MSKNQKTSGMSRSTASAESENEGVELTFSAPNARAVFVAGTFNGWDPKRTSLRKDSGGVWHASLPLTTGRYEYRFIVDGQWQEDPGAGDSVPNPHGGRNSVLTVRQTARPSMAEAKAW